MSAHPQTPDVENASIEDRLYANKYTDHEESHLGVKVEGFCEDRCDTYDCVSVCPANVWRNEGEEDGVPMIAYGFVRLTPIHILPEASCAQITYCFP